MRGRIEAMGFGIDTCKKPGSLSNKLGSLESRRGSNLSVNFGFSRLQSKLEGGIQLGHTAAPNRVRGAVHLFAVFH